MSTLAATNLKHASSASNNIVLDTSGNATFAGTAVPSSSFLRNRIINGDMRIDQRNNGASVTITTGGGYIYPVDRFGNFNNSGTNYTAEQVEDAPAGFYQSTKLTFGSAITLTTQNEITFFQIIEGNNVVDLGWGSASAQTITVSFWVKASFTGTFSIGFSNDGGTRTYATTYTISAANTWEYKTFTIPGDTSGTWLKTNGQGLYVRWNIVAGSNFQVSANNAWATRAGAYNAADSIYGTKAIGAASSISAGATWQVTGVQLEVGTAATPFERRQYGQELLLCQRYYQISKGNVYIGSATSISVPVPYFATMRGTPTAALSGGSSANVTAEYIENLTSNGARYTISTSAGGYYIDRSVALSAEL